MEPTAYEYIILARDAHDKFRSSFDGANGAKSRRAFARGCPGYSAAYDHRLPDGGMAMRQQVLSSVCKCLLQSQTAYAEHGTHFVPLDSAADKG